MYTYSLYLFLNFPIKNNIMPTTYFQIFAIIVVGGLCVMFLSSTFNIQSPIHHCYWSSNNKQESNTSKPELDPFDAYLRAHPVFGKMKYPMPETKKKVSILLIVSSAPKRADRRQAIRDTWWQQCKNTGKVNT